MESFDNTQIIYEKKASKYLFSVYTTSKGLFYSLENNNTSLKNCTSALILKKSKHIQYLFPHLNNTEEKNITEENGEYEFGNGEKITIKCQFSDSNDLNISSNWIFIIYSLKNTSFKEIPFISVQIQLTDTIEENKQLELFGYAPLFMEKFGSLNLSKANQKQNKKDITFYSNGYQSWSLNHLFFYSDKYKNCISKIGRINMENQDKTIKGQYQSEYHAVITNKMTKSSLVLSFLTLKDQFSRVLMDPLSKSIMVRKIIAYSQTDSIEIQDLNDGLKKSEVLMISLLDSPEGYEILREHQKISGYLANVKINPKILAGWCSWYYYYTKIDQDNMIKNINFFIDHPDIPIDLIQLDDGYQTCIGDWGLEEPHVFNEKFPEGLNSLVDEIHEANFKAGLWVAPFFTTKKAKLFENHPNWTITNNKNKLIKTTYNWGAFEYGLDPTQDDVLDYFKNIGRTVGEKWGFDFLKIDFIYTSSPLGAKYSDPNISRAQNIYNGVKAIKEGLTDQRTLLGCGAPLGPCVGLVDVMRIGCDTAANWQMFEKFTRKNLNLVIPALKPALLATMQRSYMHNTLWINDPDCVVVRKNRSRLTMDEIHLQLTIFGLSGGQILISDDETLVEQERINLLKKILPPYCQNLEKNDKEEAHLLSPVDINEKYYSAIPLDLFTSKFPTLYSKTIDSNFGKRFLTAVINWEDKVKNITYKLIDLMEYKESIEFDKKQDFIVFDFWKEELHGFYRSNNYINFPNIRAHGCNYLSIVPINEYSILDTNWKPAFITSTFHIFQGAAEIASYSDEKTGVIDIEMKLAGIRDGSLYFLINQEQNLQVENSNDIKELKIEKIELDSSYLAKISFELKKEIKLRISY